MFVAVVDVLVARHERRRILGTCQGPRRIGGVELVVLALLVVEPGHVGGLRGVDGVEVAAALRRGDGARRIKLFHLGSQTPHHLVTNFRCLGRVPR